MKSFRFVRVFFVIYLIVYSGLGQWQSSKLDIKAIIKNQMPLEERPYTKTPTDPSTTGPTYRTSFDKVLFPKFREMHRYCDGQCFYAPVSCTPSSSSTNFGNCQVAASIATHNQDINGELYCDVFGADNLRQSFCSSSKAQTDYQAASGNHDRFYTITLHRQLTITRLSCPDKWNTATGRRCRHQEFVAISFVNHLASNLLDLEEDDLWYVCTVDEPHPTRVSMWTNVTADPTTAQRILGTKPHLASGAGVIFSKVLFDPDTESMGCQFVIQESNMTLLNPPRNAAFFSNKMNPIKIKLAAGVVKRKFDDDTIDHPFHSLSSFPLYAVYRGSMLKPIDQIFFNALDVSISHPVLNIAAEVTIEEANRKKCEEIINKCDKPGNYPDIFIVCYPPNDQKNCVHTGRCPVMFIVEVPRSDRSFNTIKAHLYSLIPDYKSLRKVKKPTGYASVAFSEDTKMGRDVVITCHANGKADIGVYVSINYEKNNVYPGLVDYSSLVYNTQTYGTETANKILCSWEMKTKFLVNMFAYQPDYRKIIHPGQTEKLEYDFIKEPVYLFIAAGNRNYPNGTIVHHVFRQTLEGRFSAEQFFKDAKGSRFAPQLKMSLLIIFFDIALQL